MPFDNQYEKLHIRRFQRTLAFMSKHLNSSAHILDLGPENPFTPMMKEAGFNVENTRLDQDLDTNFEDVKKDFDAVTAFEIFEHMVAPFNLLKDIKAPKLFASVPLRLWFATAYWNQNDPYDCHYHEFEAKQFDFLLDKAGWKIVDSEKWTTPAGKIGLRPLLRKFVPRHYMVYCERK